MKRLISMALAVVLTATMNFTFVGCKSKAPTLNGVALENFSIVYSEDDTDYSLRAAEYLKAEILSRTGIDLPLVEDSDDAVTENEIVVGETGRDISARLNADTAGTQFAILAEDGGIALEGDYFIIAAAAYYFIETYISSDNYSTTVPKGVSVHEPIVETPKNVIMLIGDGMGVQQTKLYGTLEDTLNLGDGEDKFYGYLFPYQAFSRTDSLSGTTDSAAGGTALSSGIKTVNSFIGQDKENKDVKSLTELAISLGKSTAVMSTEVSTGATPATFSAHTTERSEAEEILADQKVLSDTYGTVINCGFDYYTKTGIGITEKNFTETVDKIDDNEKGFFMMYEEAYIDKHCHANDKTKLFRAVIRFNQVIGRAMEYAFYNPATFVLITADHETGGLYIDDSGKVKFSTTEHTSADVPVFVYGVGGEVFDGKTVENVQIPQTIATLWGVADFGDQSEYKPLNK